MINDMMGLHRVSQLTLLNHATDTIARFVQEQFTMMDEKEIFARNPTLYLTVSSFMNMNQYEWQCNLQK